MKWASGRLIPERRTLKKNMKGRDEKADIKRRIKHK
jgi:hypothetical protein